MTAKHLYRTKGDELAEKIDIKDCDDVKAEAKIGGGLLVLNHKGVRKHIVHYSAKHLSRYAYVARGIQILVSGRDEEVISKEYEKICPKCHRAIPGTKYCPHCSKEGGFWHNFFKLCAPYKKSFIGIVILMFLAAVVTLLNPEVQKRLVDDVLTRGNGSLKTAFICLGIMFALSVSIVIINILKSYYCTVLGATISKDLREKMFAKMQLLSSVLSMTDGLWELMNRIVNDTGTVQIFLKICFAICLRSVLFLSAM